MKALPITKKHSVQLKKQEAYVTLRHHNTKFRS